MRSALKIFGLILCVLALAGCGNQMSTSGDDLSGRAQSGPSSDIASASNVIRVQVSNCGPNSYFNEPCASVTICTPGTSTCQTIPNLLVDTGSYGLRIFSSAISVPLQPIKDSAGNQLAECAQFGSGASWGSVELADVVLGGEPKVQVPVHVMNAQYATPPPDCTPLDITAQSSGFNGILGVGLFVQDCGDGCVNNSQVGVYYACSGSQCQSTSVPLADQVANPVFFLPKDNNGVALVLPSVPAGGAPTATGALILGIGTEANNMPGSSQFFQADLQGNFTTQFNGQTYDSSFIDSGSNALYFPDNSISGCSGNDSGFYCPSSALSLSATQVSGSVQEAISFQVANTDSAINSQNGVFNNIAGSIGGVLASDFDWGLPFFLGRTVYVGIDGQKSSLGTGPYWAY